MEASQGKASMYVIKAIEMALTLGALVSLLSMIKKERRELASLLTTKTT